MLKEILLPPPQEGQKDKSCIRFFKFRYLKFSSLDSNFPSYYQKFFNVKTADVAFRLRSALFPFSTQFAMVTRDKPDL